MPKPATDGTTVDLLDLPLVQFIRHRGFRTVPQLAEASGVSTTTIYHAGNGARIAEETRAKLCAQLKINDDQLLRVIANAHRQS